MDIKPICENRKARHNYDIEEGLEAGLILLGSEVKSLREGRANLKDSYCRIRGREALLFNFHISPYPPARENHEPDRVKKLLLHKRQMKRLMGKSRERGYTLIPLKVYFKDGLAKVELALAKGRKAHDKRAAIRKKAEALEISRAMKSRRR